MQAKGLFIFKSLEKKDGGKFTNERGQEVSYAESYQLKVDENNGGSINERKLKISKDNDVLIQKLMKKNPYDKIELLCDIQFYGSVARVIPVDLVDGNNK